MSVSQKINIDIKDNDLYGFLIRVRNKRGFAVCFTVKNSLDTYVLGGTGGWGEGYFLIHAVTYRRTNKTRPIQLIYSHDNWTGFRSRMTFSLYVSNAYHVTSFHYLMQG